jgi:hypothetical protein
VFGGTYTQQQKAFRPLGEKGFRMLDAAGWWWT